MFYFKGISSDEMGVIAEEEDFMARAALRTQENIIDGVNGSDFDVLGYSNVSIPLKLYILYPDRLDEIFQWLTGQGKLEYNGRITNVCFFNELHPIRSSNIKTLETTMIRSPFWYDVADSFYKVIGDCVVNIGTAFCAPIIKLTGNKNEKVDLTIGEVRFTYTFDSAGYVDIDCYEKTEIAEGLRKSKRLSIGFDYPILKPGKNKVILNSGKCDIYIKRKDCWL